MRPNDPVVICFSLSPVWIPALESAAASVRSRNPKMPDAEILECIFAHGICGALRERSKGPSL